MLCYVFSELGQVQKANPASFATSIEDIVLLFAVSLQICHSSDLNVALGTLQILCGMSLLMDIKGAVSKTLVIAQRAGEIVLVITANV